MPASFNSPGCPSLPEQCWETEAISAMSAVGPALPLNAQHCMTVLMIATHRRLLGKDMGSSNTSQACLRTLMSDIAKEFWKLPQG